MTKELEQTAVEKLFHKLWDTPKDKFTWYALLKEAKEMEKEQMRKIYSSPITTNEDGNFVIKIGRAHV